MKEKYITTKIENIVGDKNATRIDFLNTWCKKRTKKIWDKNGKIYLHKLKFI